MESIPTVLLNDHVRYCVSCVLRAQRYARIACPACAGAASSRKQRPTGMHHLLEFSSFFSSLSILHVVLYHPPSFTVAPIATSPLLPLRVCISCIFVSQYCSTCLSSTLTYHLLTESIISLLFIHFVLCLSTSILSMMFDAHVYFLLIYSFSFFITHHLIFLKHCKLFWGLVGSAI